MQNILFLPWYWDINFVQHGSLEKLANTYIFAKLQERTHIYCSLKQKWTLEAGKQQHFKSFLNILPWP